MALLRKKLHANLVTSDFVATQYTQGVSSRDAVPDESELCDVSLPPAQRPAPVQLPPPQLHPSTTTPHPSISSEAATAKKPSRREKTTGTRRRLHPSTKPPAQRSAPCPAPLHPSTPPPHPYVASCPLLLPQFRPLATPQTETWKI